MLMLSRIMLAALLLVLAFSRVATAQVHLSLSDSVDATQANLENTGTGRASAGANHAGANHASADHESAGHESPVYSSRVSHDPGWPRKPVWDRPGDINQADSPAPRYCQDDCFRAGWPHSVREHAKCSITSHYSAWYVGGGSAFGLPHSRSRTAEEGTWGLDYSLFKKPQLVWMRWTCGREQGGEGAYATDR